MSVQLPVGYKPSASEEFMNPSQAEYFRRKLVQLRTDTRRELDATPFPGEADSLREGDQADQASAAVDREFDVVNRERAQVLLQQIERALVRLDNGSYGICEDTGEPDRPSPIGSATDRHVDNRCTSEAGETTGLTLRKGD